MTAGRAVLLAGAATAVLVWVTATSTPLVSQAVGLALVAAVVVAAAVVAARARGPERALALLGGGLALLPLVVVAVFLSLGDG